MLVSSFSLYILPSLMVGAGRVLSSFSFTSSALFAGSHLSFGQME